ncbi:MAG: 50S ribosomal protein L22 [Patescibacteria group bacterium]|nr:50S ribosomal protein L22 [Patescibacteria group bacterium]
MAQVSAHKPAPSPAAPKGPAVTAAAPRTVLAHLRFLRMSPRKVRLVASAVQRMPAVTAIDYLKVMPKAAALPVSKLIASAVANASHNFQIAKEDLIIQQILVNQGPTLKRFRPRAFGRAGQIRKRSCHLSVTLMERAGAVRAQLPSKAKAASEEVKTVTLGELRRGVGLGSEAGKGKADETKGGAGKGFRRKLFQRKAG